MTPPQKDEFVKRLERTSLISNIVSIASALIFIIGIVFYVKFQTEANTRSIEELKNQKADKAFVEQEQRNNSAEHQAIRLGIEDLKKGQDRTFNFLLEHKN
jgi:hypothetical protein